MQHCKTSPKRSQLDKVQKCNPTARIAFSSILKRSDDQSLNTKGKTVNELLDDELTIKGMDIINNNNIMYSNLLKDGLHVNDGGVHKYSANLSKFAKYCSGEISNSSTSIQEREMV